METIYSHRPRAGVSVGARNVNGTLYVAFALVNDGSSRNGIFWQDRRDTFCRTTARSIINGRIDHAVCVENAAQVDHPFVLSFETNMTPRQFMAEFRQGFKPTPDETDTVLNMVVPPSENDYAVEARYRMTADAITETITNLATEVANAGASV